MRDIEGRAVEIDIPAAFLATHHETRDIVITDDEALDIHAIYLLGDRCERHGEFTVEPRGLHLYFGSRTTCSL